VTTQPKGKREATIAWWPSTSWLDPVDITRTGLQTFLAGLFGSFADKREVLAALYPSSGEQVPKDFDYSQHDEVWFDYVCDTGDGWHPTYSIACLVGKDELVLNTSADAGITKLKRGSFMVLGGDQVYPVASAETYRNRMEGPFYAARATSWEKSNRIPVYALPGNHDWYDGLTSFIRLFCQKDRWVGQWRATQTRSYFAIKLPHNWWIWGLDVQLESDVDVPQSSYFKHYAGLLNEGDRVILVSPEPTWIEAGRTSQTKEEAAQAEAERREKEKEAVQPKKTATGIAAAADSKEGSSRKSDASNEGQSQAHRNMMHLERLIHRRGATIPIKIAGDLHHYARYRSAEGHHLITCGGGGAFLHGTYGLPEVLELPIPSDDEDPGASSKALSEKFVQQGIVPSEKESKRFRKHVLWRLLIQNPWFVFAVGVIYWIYSWLLQSASESLTTLEWRTPGIPTLFDYFRADRCATWNPWFWPHLDLTNFFYDRTPCSKVFWAWLDIFSRVPLVFIYTLIVVGGCAAFAASCRRAGSRWWIAAAIGAVHGAAHIALALILIKLATAIPQPAWISPPQNWAVHPLLIFGGIPGSLLMAAYLWIGHMVYRLHDQEVLSTQGIADYKCFARFHVTKENVTIYPVGLAKACRKWKLGEGVVLKKLNRPPLLGRWRWEYIVEVPHGTKRIFEPENDHDLKPRLLERPITVPEAASATVSPSRGSPPDPRSR
jgi:hypothetical protein